MRYVSPHFLGLPSAPERARSTRLGVRPVAACSTRPRDAGRGRTSVIDDHPRLLLATLPTPVTSLDQPAGRRGVGGLLVKRDDLTGFGVAGNKARPLEYLLGGALAAQAGVVVGGGAPKSNFIAGLALAARVAGLDCELLVPGGPGGDQAGESPTVEFARACGARVRHVEGPREGLDDLILDRAAGLGRTGRPAVGVPRGGSTPVGALGFARAAVELAGQVGDDPLTVVVPSGSGGSMAGLSAGTALVGAPWRLVGVSVSRPPDEAQAQIAELARGCARLLGLATAAPFELVDARGERLDDDREASAWMLESHGLLLDPVYGVRALPVALGLAGAGQRVLLWYTGGLPSAFDLVRARGRRG